ncbi:MAG: septal ring lytic transglycosylase RlpA family protein [Bacteroidota bacterium]|nr:septal ring lytic transglycosylase RlpA family protein [Bacteroidota bacterium]
MRKIILFIFFVDAVSCHNGFSQKLEKKEGRASYYGTKFHGKTTASGEIFDMNKMTAAHPKLPFNTLVKVTNKLNNKAVIVRINDRGPFSKYRIIDVSKAAARQLGMVEKGTANVILEVLEGESLYGFPDI